MEVDGLGVLGSLYVGLKCIATGAGDIAEFTEESLRCCGAGGRGGGEVLLESLLVGLALQVGLVRL